MASIVDTLESNFICDGGVTADEVGTWTDWEGLSRIVGEDVRPDYLSRTIDSSDLDAFMKLHREVESSKNKQKCAEAIAPFIEANRYMFGREGMLRFLNEPDRFTASLISASCVLDFAVTASLRPKAIIKPDMDTFSRVFYTGSMYADWLSDTVLGFHYANAGFSKEGLVIKVSYTEAHGRFNATEAALRITDELFRMHLSDAYLCHSGGVQHRQAHTLLGEYWISASDLLSEGGTIKSCDTCGYPFLVDTSVKNHWKKNRCDSCGDWVRNQNLRRRKHGVTDAFIKAHPPKRGLYADEYLRGYEKGKHAAHCG